MAIRDPAFPEPLPDHFRSDPRWGSPAYYSPEYKVLIRAMRGAGGPYFKADWGVDADGRCIDPARCSDIAHIDFWTVVEEVEDRMNAPVFDIEAWVPGQPEEQPLWGPRRGERHEKPEIPPSKPWREWWYKGYGQSTSRSRFEMEHADDIERVARTFGRFLSMDLPMWSREDIIETIRSKERPVDLSEYLYNWHDHMKEALVHEGFSEDDRYMFDNLWHTAYWKAIENYFYWPEAGVLVTKTEYEPPTTYLPPPEREREEFEREKRALGPEVPETRRWWYKGYGQPREWDEIVVYEDQLEKLQRVVKKIGPVITYENLHDLYSRVTTVRDRYDVDFAYGLIQTISTDLFHRGWIENVNEVGGFRFIETRQAGEVAGGPTFWLKYEPLPSHHAEWPREELVPEYEPPTEFLSPTREREEEERLRRAARAPDVPETRKWWYMGYGGNMSDKDLRKRAEELAWRDSGDSYWEGPTDGSDKGNWAATISKHRDSGLLDESNYTVIVSDMQRRFPNDVEEHHFRHWAVGWADHLFVRIYDANGEFTPAFDAIVEWEQKLADYPVADEEDYSNREYEATLENIEFAGRSLVRDGAPPDWPGQVYSWLSENNESAVENRDDRGGYPSGEEIKEALYELDLLDPDHIG